MNSFVNRELEIYNFSNISGNDSTEYNNVLINKNIDNYFNDLINKPISDKITGPVFKSNYTLEKFYSDFIKDNFLFIILLIGIVIFLIIRYYSKDFDDFTLYKNYNLNKNNNNEDINENNEDINENNNEDINENNNLKNKLLKKQLYYAKKRELEKIQLLNYKKRLDEEKEKILSIIDELSSINSYEYQNKNTNQEIPNYLKNNINRNYENNYTNSQNYFNQINENENEAHNIDENTEYYNIKRKTDKINEIDGIYIEPPFN